MLLALIGAAVTTTGILCLYTSWRRVSPRHANLKWAGWLLLLVGSACWAVTRGTEYGLVYALATAAVAAWAAAGINAELRAQQQKPKQSGRLAPPAALSALKHLGLLVVAVPLAGATAILGSAALTLVLPWQAVNEMVFAVFLMPIIWGLAAYWVCAAGNLIGPALALALCTGISAALLFS